MAEHDTGAPWSLPYPDLNEPADVPADIQQLAVAVAAKLTQMTVDFVPPVGSMFMWATSVAPAHYKLCDGTSYLRADLPALFTAIGTAYGSADGTHFTIPDLRGRVPVGVDGAAARLLSSDTLAASGGEEKHVISTAEMALHTHDIVSSGYEVPATNGVWQFSGFAGGSSPNWVPNAPAGGTFGQSTVTLSKGSNSAHNNMQPFQIVNFIIRFE